MTCNEHNATNPINVDKAFLYEAYKATLDYLRDLLIRESEVTIETKLAAPTVITKSRPSYRDKDYGMGDDSHDDLSSLLQLSEFVRFCYYEGDKDSMSKLLNTPFDENDPRDSTYDFQLGNLAGDGIPQFFYDLNCPALPKG